MVGRAVGMLALWLVAAPVSAQTLGPVALQPGETLLEVQSQGEARVLPDTARLSIGVVSTGADVKAATDANAVQMQRVLSALRQAGVEDRFVLTQQINVQPRLARDGPQDYEGQPRITGFVARNSAAVTIVKLSATPAVVAAAFQAGANSVSGPDLTTDNDQLGVPEARAAALRKARAAADAYATNLSLRVGRLLRVSERGTYADTVSYAVSPSDIVVTGQRVATPIAAGQLRRRVNLWVDFALSPR